MTEVIKAARTYLGVPFKHRGRDRRGLDCAGLAWCAFRDVGRVLPDVKRYGREPHRDGLMETCRLAFGEPVWEGEVDQVVPRDLVKVGDLVVIRFELHPHHIALVGYDPLYGLSMIHADGSPAVRRVVEHGLDLRCQRMVCAVFRSH
jgi:cell wall-associated NlpC family hydrolase